MEHVAMYPGSFDPMTFGHLDIIRRATQLFDKVLITIAVNTQKKYVFSPEERLELLQRCLKQEGLAEKTELHTFTGLLVEHARKNKVNTLIRGVRQISDFEYEFRMALMNRKLAPEVDTVFLMPREEYTFVSATLVKEVAFWDGPLEQFVPQIVANALRKKQVGKEQVASK